VYAQAPEKNFRTINVHSVKIEYFSMGARFDNPIIVSLTIRPIEVISAA